MSPTDWVSCSIAFLALLASIPSLVHTIKSRLQIEICLLDFQKSTKGEQFAYYLKLRITNITATPYTLLNVELLTSSGYKPLTNVLGKNLKIVFDNKIPTIDATYFFANEMPLVKRNKIKIRATTNLKKFVVKLSIQ